MNAPTILFAAGGTGGHIYPAIAVADALRELVPGVEIAFVGTEYGLESRIVPHHGYPLETIDVRFLKGVSAAKKIKHAALLPRSAWQSWRLLRRRRPALVVGAGGYASGPITAMAAMLRTPTAIMEQNAIPGLTNRLLAKVAKRIFVSFESERYDTFAKDKVHALGNPVRRLEGAHPDVPRREGAINLLVFGGSQGAGTLNEHMPRILDDMGERAATVHVRHQTGRGRHESVEAAWKGFAGTVDVHEFIHDMPGAYAWADVVVCRAGATTCAELKAAGKPAILVPFPHAAHNHQEENARAMVDAGAAQMVLDADMGGDVMKRMLGMAIAAPHRLDAMARRAREIAQPDAARDVALSCLEMIGHPAAHAASIQSAHPGRDTDAPMSTRLAEMVA